MVFYTSGRRIELELTRSVVFFRFPLIGDVCKTRTFGWEYVPWRDVRSQLQAACIAAAVTKPAAG
jgi:hypothetical protein